MSMIARPEGNGDAPGLAARRLPGKPNVGSGVG